MQLLLGRTSIRTIAECIVHVVRPLLGAALLFGTAYAPIDRERQAHEEEMREMMTMPTADALSRYLDLASQQMKLTAANMANQNTTGYTRRSVTFSSGDSVVIGGRSTSTGVTTSVTAQRDGVLQRAVLQATEASSASSTRLSALNNLQSLFAINSDGEDAAGIGAAISTMFSSASSLAASPQDNTVRQTALTSVQAFAGTMNRAAAQIGLQANGLGQNVTASLSQVNGLLAAVASFNTQIVRAGVGADTSTLQDQRDLAIAQLAKFVDVNTVAVRDGSINLSLSDGSPLVSGASTSELSTTVSNGTLRVLSGTSDVTGAIQGGSIGGALQARDIDLPAMTSQLDALSASIASAMNAQNALGADANGNPGRPIFTGTFAGTLRVSITSGSGIAASSDGSNAASLAALGNQKLVGGLTASEVLSSMITSLGQSAAAASTSSSADAAVLTQTSTQLASVSGVSLDTEAANLTQYQRSYQAAAKILAIVNELMGQAINLGTETTVS